MRVEDLGVIGNGQFSALQHRSGESVDGIVQTCQYFKPYP
jgi:hypothetical protein